MSATEIIAEIKKLPREEQQKIAVFLEGVEGKATNQRGAGVGEQFKRATDEVFRTNDELFRKLAQ